MNLKIRIIIFLICISMQLILSIPIYIIYKKDCKQLGKENLAVSFKERFIASILVFPLWILPFLIK